MHIFASAPGRVAVLPDVGIPINIRLENWPGFSGINAAITSITLGHQANVQFLHTLRDVIYAYVFGERIGDLAVGGVAFLGDGCPDLARRRSGFELVYDYYDANRVSRRGTPLTLTVGSLGIRGVLIALNLQANDAALGIANFTLQFKVFPRTSLPADILDIMTGLLEPTKRNLNLLRLPIDQLAKTFGRIARSNKTSTTTQPSAPPAAPAPAAPATPKLADLGLLEATETGLLENDVVTLDDLLGLDAARVLNMVDADGLEDVRNALAASGLNLRGDPVVAAPADRAEIVGLGLTFTTDGRLARAAINTLADLTKLTEAEVLAIVVDDFRLEAVRAALAAQGLSFKP